MMRCFGFIESLADVPEINARWTELSAGLAVFRIAESALAGVSAERETLDLARRQVFRILDLPLRSRLGDVLSTATGGALLPDRQRDVLSQLMAYGLELHARGDLRMAVDVFALASDNARRDHDLRLQAMFRRAYALRLLNRFEDADITYQELLALAVQVHDTRMQLEAQLGRGKVLMDRGNYPGSEPIVIDVIRRARALRDRLMVAKALIERARIAGVREDPVGVLVHSVAALELLEPGTDRDRTLVNVAIALRELDRGATSFQIARQLSEEAVDQDQRTAATLLLYNLAADRQDVATAERCIRALEAAELTPISRVEYYEARARDSAVRGSSLEALVFVRRMLEFAEAHSLTEIIFRAERALEDLAEGRSPAIYSFRPTSLEPTTAQRVDRAEAAANRLCAV